MISLLRPALDVPELDDLKSFSIQSFIISSIVRRTLASVPFSDNIDCSIWLIERLHSDTSITLPLTSLSIDFKLDVTAPRSDFKRAAAGDGS